MSAVAWVPLAPINGSLGSGGSAIGGTLMFVAGVVILMGIITAEALYPVTYTTSGNEISDLGGTRPPEALVFQPSSTGSSGGRSSPSA